MDQARKVLCPDQGDARTIRYGLRLTPRRQLSEYLADAQSGPIIRVTPDEIHISDPLFYHELFVPFNVRRTNAYTRYAQGTGFEDIFAIIHTHEGHKVIRDPVEKLYGKIATHEPLVLGCTKNFRARLDQERDTGKLINLSHACLSLAIDVATTVTFQAPSNYLEEPTFNENLSDIDLYARMIVVPAIQVLASRIPELKEWDEKTRRQTFRTELQEPTMKLQGRASIWKRANFASRIGQLIQQNGIFHVSHTIETIITQLAMDKSQLQKLQDELAQFWAEKPDKVTSWYALRELPYLTACIHEGLRFGRGFHETIATRIP
ncbi:Cytochrome P450 [Penicillium chermesinum]|nr:Cytochrome P450 [Penicillium chermesinum]